ncbi:hypothetical protein CBR_g45368 [Chara braunii]|uniref:Uncharacterized protein n=1 Tax=Chara braunii TaxID=69332 RepID=A0A388LYA9_CHABU|nr:hypothetical protein CBR_g45368 [Chara braunii]|eukprot:GBG87308.1 hypothetical protein CBR_g45368 [Chara braunii]
MGAVTSVIAARLGAATSGIAAKFAFFPPDPPSYKLVKDEVTGKICMSGVEMRKNEEVMWLSTRRKQDISAMYVTYPNAKLTIIYSHGNAADLGQMHELYVELSNLLKVNVFGYDYTGYGACTGKPSEQNTYADIDAALECLKEKYGVREEDIVLYGQSVGSGPTVDLASRVDNFRGVVLHSPILSGVRVIYNVKRSYWFDIYKNCDKIESIKCPILVMHGTNDEVVDCSHGKRLHELCKNPFEPLWIEGGKHCDLEFFPQHASNVVGIVVTLCLHLRVFCYSRVGGNREGSYVVGSMSLASFAVLPGVARASMSSASIATCADAGCWFLYTDVRAIGTGLQQNPSSSPGVAGAADQLFHHQVRTGIQDEDSGLGLGTGTGTGIGTQGWNLGLSCIYKQRKDWDWNLALGLGLGLGLASGNVVQVRVTLYLKASVNIVHAAEAIHN